MSNQQQHEINPASVLSALQGRIGAVNGINAATLVQSLTGRLSTADQRRLRDCVVLLRIEGHPVCATPEDGYFMAANDSELNRTCKFLLGRVNTGLAQIAALKKKALPDLAGQLGLELEEQETTNVCNV